jgi:hypothetical protein
MRYKQCIIVRDFIFIAFLSLLTVAMSPSAIADTLKPVPGKFTATLQGVDPDTYEMIFEGSKTGPIPGHLVIRAGITRQTGLAIHLAPTWTLTTPGGETIKGENTGVLNTTTLTFHEHGIIVEATGDYQERVGNFVVIRGEISDLEFYPGITQVSGHVTYVPAISNMLNK